MGKVFLAMCFATTHASASHVVLLWSLRYLVTIHPLWRLKVTTKRVFFLSLILWILSALFGAVYYILRFLTCLDKFYIVIGVRGYLLITPCAVILTMHAFKVRVIRRSLYQQNIKQRVVRMSKMVGIILFLYMSSAVLFPVTFVMEYYEVCYNINTCKGLLTVARLFWLLNSALNPVLYFLFAPVIQKKIKGLTNKCRGKLQTSEEGTPV